MTVNRKLAYPRHFKRSRPRHEKILGIFQFSVACPAKALIESPSLLSDPLFIGSSDAMSQPIKSDPDGCIATGKGHRSRAALVACLNVRPEEAATRSDLGGDR